MSTKLTVNDWALIDLNEIISERWIDLPDYINVPKTRDMFIAFQELYEKKEFFDFNIKIGSTQEIISVHKLFLIINGFKSLENCKEEIIVNGDKEVVQYLIDCYYNSKAIEISDNNVHQLIDISNQLGIDKLSDHLKRKKVETIFYNQLKPILDSMVLETPLKRKNDFTEIKSNKQMKTSFDETFNDCNRWTQSLTPINDKSSDSLDTSLNPRMVSIDLNDASNGLNQSISESIESIEWPKSLDQSNDTNKYNNEDKDNNNPIIINETVYRSEESEEKPLTTQITEFIPEDEEEDKGKDNQDKVNVLNNGMSSLNKEKEEMPQTKCKNTRNESGIDYLSEVINSVTSGQSSAQGAKLKYLNNKAYAVTRKSSRKSIARPNIK